MRRSIWAASLVLPATALGQCDPVIVGERLDPGWQINHVAVKDHVLYVIVGQSGTVFMFDASRPDLHWFDSLEVSWNGSSLAVEGDSLLVGTRDTSDLGIVWRYDISERSEPVLKKWGVLGWAPRVMEASGGLGFAAMPLYSISLFDFLTPDLYQWYRGEIYLGPDRHREVFAADGDFCYVAVNDEIRIFDVSDPGTPTEASRVNNWRAGALHVQDSVLYAAKSSGQIAAIDVRDPTQPRVLGLTSETARNTDLASLPGLLIAADRGVRVFDVRDPSDPTEIYTLELPVNIRHLALTGSLLIAAGDEAMYAIDLSSCLPCLADLDGSGDLDIFDFLEFQRLFAAGDVRADFDRDGSTTIFDFLAFQNAFEAGC